MLLPAIVPERQVPLLYRIAHWHERFATELEDIALSQEASGLSGDAVVKARAKARLHRSDAAELRELARAVNGFPRRTAPRARQEGRRPEGERRE